MKKFLIIATLILSCACPVWGDDSTVSDIGHIKINVKDGYLNLRSEPDEKSKIIAKLPKDTHLNYDDDFRKSWVKVNYSKHIKGDYVEQYSGWIKIDFLEAPNFKSQILYPVDLCAKSEDISQNLCDYSGCSSWIENAVGTIVFTPGTEIKDGFYINLKGKLVNLSFEKEKIGYVLYNKEQNIRLEIYTYPAGDGYESWWSKGFMKIIYKDMAEIIFIVSASGC